jgi:hypothetical protein
MKTFSILIVTTIILVFSSCDKENAQGLKHAYPTGAAASNWAWLKQYTLP